MRPDAFAFLKPNSRTTLCQKGNAMYRLLPFVLLIGCTQPTTRPDVQATAAVEQVTAQKPAITPEIQQPKFFRLSVHDIAERGKVAVVEAKEIGGKKQWTFTGGATAITATGISDTQIEKITIGAQSTIDAGINPVICATTAAQIFANKEMLRDFQTWFDAKPTPPAISFVDGMQAEYTVVDKAAVLTLTPVEANATSTPHLETKPADHSADENASR